MTVCSWSLCSYLWNVTFTTAVGNIDLLTARSFLFGGGARVETGTVRDGNEIGGVFSLVFQGYRTNPIDAQASAAALKSALLQVPIINNAGIVLVPLATSPFPTNDVAEVTRTDPTGNCNDGLCPNGPYPSHGLLWTVFVTTNLTQDDLSPSSPTSPLALQEAPFYRFTAITTGLTGFDPAVDIYFGGSESNEAPQNLLLLQTPFSLAYGGAGGSYGGQGGAGYAPNNVGPRYNDERLSDLLGGSGGCMGGIDPYMINSALGPVGGNGGTGGGAIEFVAANDIIIGTFGKLLTRGGDGLQGAQGGPFAFLPLCLSTFPSADCNLSLSSWQVAAEEVAARCCSLPARPSSWKARSMPAADRAALEA